MCLEKIGHLTVWFFSKLKAVQMLNQVYFPVLDFFFLISWFQTAGLNFFPVLLVFSSSYPVSSHSPGLKSLTWLSPIMASEVSSMHSFLSFPSITFAAIKTLFLGMCPFYFIAFPLSPLQLAWDGYPPTRSLLLPSSFTLKTFLIYKTLINPSPLYFCSFLP